MSKLHGLARVMKRAQNENAPGTPVIEVCTPASGSMAPGKGVGAVSTSSMVGVVVISTAASATCIIVWHSGASRLSCLLCYWRLI
jgi:hypothetical protein